MSEELGPCPICGRPVVKGASANRHHWTPRAKGGRDWAWLHRVCHRKLHAQFTEAELARDYATPEQLRAHPEIARFIEWVRKKPPEFYDSSVTAKAKGSRGTA